MRTMDRRWGLCNRIAAIEQKGDLVAIIRG